MAPSQIPIQALNEVNFAFAYIDPNSFDIVPMPGTDMSLFTQIPALKQNAPDTKFFISLGGWSFNDNGTTTQTVFSHIAASSTYRDIFSHKVFSFCKQYGFDGVDIDWEYPGAPDRGGSPSDVSNFPLLLAALKDIAAVPFQPLTVSITVPTSYWYLRWFDLPEISQHIDFFNLMSYDLHGVWDSSDPIGSHIYAHTNLTEIDLALDLFWRVKISPSMINLGLAFYGRSFTLTDPSCYTPGCGFHGPGAEGDCTKSAGILSYREIQDILATAGAGNYVDVYDPVAAVNYLVYDQNKWVSYDNKQSWQAKIDYANSVGLRGLFIWAIDQDDDNLDALKSVTGKDLIPNQGLSQTLGAFDTSKCVITKCFQSCPMGWTKMTSLNQDSTGESCKTKNHHARSLCCPSWGAPDPGTCAWHGSAPECFGQCPPGQVGFATDNYGTGSKCNHGVKQFCCPATGNAALIASCGPQGKCGGSTPQKISTWGTGKGIFHPKDDYCCPAQPIWKNCQWHGSHTTCSGNRCPNGQVEMARNVNSDGSSFSQCVLRRQAVLCCDPAFNDTSGAFLPVQLDWLFPDTLPANDQPDYAEAFDHNPDQRPNPVFMGGGEDPQQESFAWIVMVGPPGSYQSLTKRDGSHLEAFDCPNPASHDYRAQKLKVVCMVEGDNNNCEDINIEGAYGTIAKLPEECGPDTYIRVVSYDRTDSFELPSHLEERAPPQPKVYELRYDYNLRKLKRADSDVYVRLDISNHPGYWNEIVNTAPDGSKRKREADYDWRADQIAWFEREIDHGVSKRGFSSNSKWWLDRFNSLISNGGGKVGLNKEFDFSQVLYNASKGCPPGANAQIEALFQGDAKFSMDFGITLIGTLTNFRFQEAYAYFTFNGMEMSTAVTLIANAGVAFQSQLISIIENYPLFGAGYNLKGLFTLGPYFDVKAQLQAQATMAGSIVSGTKMTVPGGYTFMLPQGLGPENSEFDFILDTPIVEAGTKAAINSNGSVSISVVPAIGFKLELDALGQQLVNTDIRFDFTNTMISQISASSTSDCNGALIGTDWSNRVDFTINNPFVLWGSVTHFNPYKSVRTIQPVQCWPWAGSTAERRSIAGNPYLYNSNLSTSIARRQSPIDLPPLPDSAPLFPDPYAAALSCPGGRNTPSGDCFAFPNDFGDDPTDGGAVEKRSYIEGHNASVPGLREVPRNIQKRAFKTLEICGNKAKQVLISPRFDSSKQNIKSKMGEKNRPWTYGPTKPDDCDDYGFGRVDTPDMDQSSKWATEHILEFQMLQIFLNNAYQEPETFFPYPAADAAKPKPPTPSKDSTGNEVYNFCKYLKFWWGVPRISIGNVVPKIAIDFVTDAYPGKEKNSDELVLIEKETNLLKESIWSDDQIRTDDTMNGYEVNEAINVCKKIMNVIKYQVDSDTQTILKAQAARVAEAFDDAEEQLGKFATGDYAALKYQNLGLGKLWKVWIKNRNNYAGLRARGFLDTWVPRIVRAHLPPDDPAATAPGADVETNPAIIKRIKALQAAYAGLPAWPDPFGSDW